MNKVLVIGCPGSGKSTFSRALQQVTDLPLFHLDMLYWNPDGTAVPKKTVFQERLRAVMSGERWIIDGNYGSTMELRMAACDTVIFLDSQQSSVWRASKPGKASPALICRGKVPQRTKTRNLSPS